MCVTVNEIVSPFSSDGGGGMSAALSSGAGGRGGKEWGGERGEGRGRGSEEPLIDRTCWPQPGQT